MDELASTLLDRINSLAKKCIKEGDNFNAEQRHTALVRITENVRLIKRIEKVSGLEDDDDDVQTSAHHGRESHDRKGRKSVSPSAV